MKRLLLLMTFSLMARAHQKIQPSYESYLEEDMNQIPIVMDEALYKMSCADIKKNSVAIKVLQDEIHTYMIRTDKLVLRVAELERRLNQLPWYKRFLRRHKK